MLCQYDSKLLVEFWAEKVQLIIAIGESEFLIALINISDASFIVPSECSNRFVRFDGNVRYTVEF